MNENPQRRHPRVPVEMSVRLTTIDPEPDPRTGRPFFRASRELCANLSPGGAFIRTIDPLSPGRRVLVEIEGPQGEAIEAVGRVAWSRTIIGASGRVEGSGAGVEFLSGSDGKREDLQGFLARCGGSEPPTVE
jgi:Tfp pilus assembly protein PilZ